jgi:hypothetical protein
MEEQIHDEEGRSGLEYRLYEDGNEPQGSTEAENFGW